jgi:DNA-binding transcriptional ArsR family regulator
MVTLRFTTEDLARTRFAISPMWELITSLRVLRDPDRAALHLPWVREALPIARELDLDGALALTPPEGYMPDFITPPPTGPLASFEEEVERVCGTPRAQVLADIECLIEEGRGSPALDAFLDRPAQEVERMCEALRIYWARTMEPHWPRVRAVLEEDLRYRARQLTESGPAGLFGDLHERVTWHGDRIEIDQPYEADVGLRGRGLLLMPSAFQVTRPASLTSPPWQPTMVYPSRGVGLLWETAPAQGPEALVKLVGGTRARLLAALGSPRSTTDLARALELSPGGVSQHLSVLRESGLVCGEREGRSVLYLRTELADSLLG